MITETHLSTKTVLLKYTENIILIYIISKLQFIKTHSGKKVDKNRTLRKFHNQNNEFLIFLSMPP